MTKLYLDSVNGFLNMDNLIISFYNRVEKDRNIISPKIFQNP